MFAAVVTRLTAFQRLSGAPFKIKEGAGTTKRRETTENNQKQGRPSRMKEAGKTEKTRGVNKKKKKKRVTKEDKRNDASENSSSDFGLVWRTSLVIAR